ncbi:MAG: hypothetical protein AAB690_02130 [Patescibacteria group bacterium]
MPDGTAGPEAMFGGNVPSHIGAVFETGKNLSSVTPWFGDRRPLVPVLDVSRQNQRDIWALENMRVFSDGTLASPELQWKGVIDAWLTELRFAERNLNSAVRERVRETEKDVIAMMAVSASARAMEHSGGSASKYVALITHSEKGDLDKQDEWAEFLLHDDASKLNRVLRNPLVKHYYDGLLRDAGVKVDNEWSDDGKIQRKIHLDDGVINGDHPDNSMVRRGELVLAEFLRDEPVDGGGYKGGYDAYINEVIKQEDEGGSSLFVGVSDEIQARRLRWAAAKLACDVFMVDKQPEWEWLIDKKGKTPMKVMPFAGWGGDPLRANLEPSFLPRAIKKVYLKPEHGGVGDDVILDMVDNAFRPNDIFERLHSAVDPIPASMVGQLKTYARYNDALWTFLGGSRAGAIPQWTKETMESLPTMAELLDQVYGGSKPKEGVVLDGEEISKNVGKHILGAMIARILECKALAATVETAKPGVKDVFKLIFGEKDEERPFFTVMKFIWGPDLDSRAGFLSSLAGGRTRVVFRENKYGAEERLNNTWGILLTNDQSPNRAKTVILHGVRTGVRIATIVSQVFGKRSG